jgi:hypothetical protein
VKIANASYTVIPTVPVAADYPSSTVHVPRPDVVILDISASDLSNEISRRVGHIHDRRADKGLDWYFGLIADAMIRDTLRFLASVKQPYLDAFRAERPGGGWTLDGAIAALPADDSDLAGRSAIRRR